VRLQANLDAHDRFAAAACMTAIRYLAADPLGRRRLLDPKQFLGTRGPDACVDGMFAGIVRLLRSPDTSLVLHAAAALHHLCIAHDTLARVQKLPEAAFREMLGGLVELMAMNLGDDPTAHDDASAALTALLGCPALLARVRARFGSRT
jgi:hypothetical protein